MFGFSLKDKAEKILKDEFWNSDPTNSWLNHIIKQGKLQEYN